MANYVNPYMQTSGWGNAAYQQNPMGSYQMQYPQQAQLPAQGSPLASNVLGYQADGEIGAKAFPMPNGATGPVVIWDTTDNVFWMRTFNQAGFPNQLEKYRFVREEIAPSLPSGQNGVDTSQMVTRDEFNQLNQKIDDVMNSIRGMQQPRGSQQNNQNNQNGSHGGR